MYLFFYQLEDVAVRTVDTAFKINPDTVFGFLVGFLVLVIVGLAMHAYYLQKDYKALRDKTALLTENAITVITNNSAVLEALGDAIHELKSATPAQIRDAETRIIKSIEDGAKVTDRILNHIKNK